VFGITDLFVAGLGLDIAGAWLLSSGLIASWRDLSLRTGSYWGGNPHAAMSAVEDRIRGSIGVASLMLGFFAQAVAYALQVSTENPSTGNAAGVVLACLLPAAIVLTGAHFAMPRLRRRGLVQVARPTRGDSRDQGPLPEAGRLLSFGKLLGENQLEGEGDDAYLRRVFGVDETATEDE
jgi:hypothetical protein